MCQCTQLEIKKITLVLLPGALTGLSTTGASTYLLIFLRSVEQVKVKMASQDSF